jgi:hypothetical protein
VLRGGAATADRAPKALGGAGGFVFATLGAAIWARKFFSDGTMTVFGVFDVEAIVVGVKV